MTSLTPTTMTATEEEEDEEEEEDTELRDLVTNLLTSNGILGKIKAQLRSNVYLALEEGSAAGNLKKPNSRLKSFLGTSEGRLVTHLVREFLSFFELNFSLSVFDPEVMEGTDASVRDRDHLLEGLGLAETASAEKPLLAEILRLSKVSVLKSETTEDESSSSVLSSLESNYNRGAPVGSAGAAAGAKDKSLEFSSQQSSPFSSLNASGAATAASNNRSGSLDNTFILKKEETPPPPPLSVSSTTATKQATPVVSKQAAPVGSSNSIVKDSPTKPSADSTAKSASDLTKSSSALSSLSPTAKPLGSSSSSSPLGNLPPLGGSRKALAPIKKPTTDNGIGSTAKKKDPPSAVVQPSTKPIPEVTSNSSSSSSNNSPPPKTAPPPIDTKSSNNNMKPKEDDDVIDEDLDEFLNSSSVSTSEDFTKDLTAEEEGVSLKADYVEKL